MAQPAVDPGVLQALDRMADYLRGLKNFELRVSTVTDEMLDHDQMAQIGRWATLKVRRPGAMRADMRDDRGDRKLLYYNGKTASLYDPGTRYYATVAAPSTIDETVQLLGQHYGIQLPVADLFYWDSNRVDLRGIKSADFLGYAEVDGRPTNHFALRQEGVDWQIWVERGATPLPRKLVITTTMDAATPQHAALLHWNLSPRFAAGDFSFKPPPGAHQIAIQTVDGTVDSAGQ